MAGPNLLEALEIGDAVAVIHIIGKAEVDTLCALAERFDGSAGGDAERPL